MNNVINSLKGVATSLTWIDIVFFSLIIVLILSFILMIYFMKINKKMLEVEIAESEKNDTKNANTYSDPEYQNIDLTEYEQAQEDGAVISYNELIKTVNKKEIKYDENYNSSSDLDIKKINIENNSVNEKNPYENEEKYLESLIELNKKLN